MFWTVGPIGDHISPPPSLHFSSPSFSLLLHCCHSGEINTEETHCFHPPAATSAILQKNAIRTLRRLEPDFTRLCRTKKFADVLQKKKSNCLLFGKRFQIPEFPPPGHQGAALTSTTGLMLIDYVTRRSRWGSEHWFSWCVDRVTDVN